MNSPIDTSRWTFDDWLVLCLFGLPVLLGSVAGCIALIICAANGSLS